MHLNHSDVAIFSGEAARERLSQKDIEQTVRILLDEIWDDAYRTFCVSDGRKFLLSQLYPELVCQKDKLPRLLFRTTDIIRKRLQDALQEPILPWTYAHARELVLQEAIELRDGGKYSVATVNDELAAVMAYKYEGRLANGQRTFTPTKAAVIDSHRGKGLYPLLRTEVLRRIGEEGIGPVLVFTKNDKVKHHTLENEGVEISLGEHQRIRADGGLRPFPESVVQLCRLNGWQAFLMPNPTFTVKERTSSASPATDAGMQIVKVRKIPDSLTQELDNQQNHSYLHVG